VIFCAFLYFWENHNANVSLATLAKAVMAGKQPFTRLKLMVPGCYFLANGVVDLEDFHHSSPMVMGKVSM
jgi:hypothetical protein